MILTWFTFQGAKFQLPHQIPKSHYQFPCNIGNLSNISEPKIKQYITANRGQKRIHPLLAVYAGRTFLMFNIAVISRLNATVVFSICWRISKK